MTIRSSLAAGASRLGLSRFAHLGARAGDPPPKDEKDDKDKKDKDAAGPEDDERCEDDKPEEDAARAEGDDDDEEDDDDDEEKKKAKKKAQEEKDKEKAEDDKKDEEKAAASRRGRRAERRRWAAVLASPHAAANLQLAVTLCADTGLSSDTIIGRLAAFRAGTRSADRQRENPEIETSAPQGGGSKSAIAAGWDRAMADAAPRSLQRRA